GRFATEIVPVTVPARRGEPTVVDTDAHPRATTLEALARVREVVHAGARARATTLEALAGLRAVFRDGGSVTAGNSAGINDAAAALLVASERAVQRYGLNPLARGTGSAHGGVAPRVMGLGPVPATRRLLDRNGIEMTEVDVV